MSSKAGYPFREPGSSRQSPVHFPSAEGSGYCSPRNEEFGNRSSRRALPPRSSPMPFSSSAHSSPAHLRISGNVDNASGAKIYLGRLPSFSDGKVSPWPSLASNLSEDELRESAYELLACAVGTRSSSAEVHSVQLPPSRPSGTSNRLSNWLKKNSDGSAATDPSASMRSREDSVRSFKTPRMENSNGDGFLGLKPWPITSRFLEGGQGESGETRVRFGSGTGWGSRKSAKELIDVVRRQLEVSEFTDMRTVKALLRAQSAQESSESPSCMVPLELLRHLKSSEFPSQNDYRRWKNRQLLVLEESFPKAEFSESNRSPNLSYAQLKHLISFLQQEDVEFQVSDISEGLAQLALKTYSSLYSPQSSPEFYSHSTPSSSKKRCSNCNQKEGNEQKLMSGQLPVHYPLNMYLYESLLQACFDREDRGAFIQDRMEVLELLQETWPYLGITEVMHSLCFTWVLFHRFISTGHSKLPLLATAEAQLKEVLIVSKEFCAQCKRTTSELMRAVAYAIQICSENRLGAYHAAFPEGGKGGVLERLLSMSILSAEILRSVESNGFYVELDQQRRADLAAEKTEIFVRQSLKSAFSTLHDNAVCSRRTFPVESPPGSGVMSNLGNSKGRPPSPLVILAEDAEELMHREMELFSPTLKRYHLNAAGLAAASLHSSFKEELRVFLIGVIVLNLEAAEVLLAADNLEKELVRIVAEEGSDLADGGKGLISSMTPYETGHMMTSMSRRWVASKMRKLKDSVDKCVDAESWDPESYRDSQYASSAKEILRLVEESLESFFRLPLPPKFEVLEYLVQEIDLAIQQFCNRVLASLGPKEAFSGTDAFSGLRIPSLGSSSHLGLEASSIRLPQMCIRVNTLQTVLSDMEILSERILVGWDPPQEKSLPNPGKLSKPAQLKFSPSFLQSLHPFESSKANLESGASYLCQLASLRVVFFDLKEDLRDGIYEGNLGVEATVFRIQPFISSVLKMVKRPLRERFLLILLQTFLHAILQVLLAKGSHGAYLILDSHSLDRGLYKLKELFHAQNEGLPHSKLERNILPCQQVLSLFGQNHTDPIVFKRMNDWIENAITKDNWHGSSLRSLSMPTSVVDLLGVLEEMTELYFYFVSTPSSGSASNIIEIIFQAIRAYLCTLVSTLDPMDQFVPKMLPLTRFDKDILGKAQSNRTSTISQTQQEVTSMHRENKMNNEPSSPDRKISFIKPDSLPTYLGGSQASKESGLSISEEAFPVLPILAKICAVHDLSTRVLTLLDKIQRGPNSSSHAVPSKKRETNEDGPDEPDIEFLNPTPFFFSMNAPYTITSSSTASSSSSLSSSFSSNSNSSSLFSVEFLTIVEEVQSEIEKTLDLLSEYAACRVIFSELRSVFLDDLYVGGVPRVRISNFLDKLQPFLTSLRGFLPNQVEDRIVGSLLHASVKCMFRVLLAGGPFRAYSISDVSLLDADVKALKRVFMENDLGNLPASVVNKALQPIERILLLFRCDTDELIHKFEALNQEATRQRDGQTTPSDTAKSYEIPPLPGSPDQWTPTPSDPNTLLRVLCYRADKRASHFLKKAFRLPKELPV